MESKLCPHCKKTTQCTLIKDESLLNWTYKCSECKNEFERETYFKQSLGVAGSIAAIAGTALLFIVSGGKQKKF